MTRALTVAAAALALLLTGCASAHAQAPKRGAVESGRASWYGGKFHGRKTASGERFDERKLTAAHRSLPFGTRVRVTNLNNGKQVVVRINDRGPWGMRKIIDVSEAAARKLGMIRAGVVPVKVEVLELGKGKGKSKGKGKRTKRRKR